MSIHGCNKLRVLFSLLSEMYAPDAKARRADWGPEFNAAVVYFRNFRSEIIRVVLSIQYFVVCP